jgi:hypothetical protein
MTFQEYLNRHRVDVEASDNGVELTSMWFAHGLMAREVRDSPEEFSEEVRSFFEKCERELSLITPISGHSYDPTTLGEWRSARETFWQERVSDYVRTVLNNYKN